MKLGSLGTRLAQLSNGKPQNSWTALSRLLLTKSFDFPCDVFNPIHLIVPPMNPENTHKLMGFYMEVLVLALYFSTWFLIL